MVHNGSKHQGSHGHHGHHNHYSHIEIGPKLVIAFIVTASVFIAELIGGYWTHSLALLSDAWHVLTDALALGMAWLAFQQSKRKPTVKKTFGYHRFEVIVAFINGLSLIFISLLILYEGIERLIHPQVVRSREMFIIALIGLLANGLIALLLHKSARGNLNVRGAFLHVIGDAVASVGVIIGGLLMNFYQWYFIDPVLSIMISLLIIRGALRVTKEAFHILMEGTPDDIDLSEIKRIIETIPGVANVHDMHAWSISGQMNSASMHVQFTSGDPENILQRIKRLLLDDFGIRHSTIQVERNCNREENQVCDLSDG